MFERVRGWISSLTGGADDGRYVSRAAREERQRRILIFATAGVALAVILALVAGAIWQYFLMPRQTYATVNGVDIQRSDYEKYRIYTLLQQLTGLTQQLQTSAEDQRPAIQQQIATLQLELEDLESGDRTINPEALQAMIQDQLVLQGLDEFSIVITNDEVDEYVLQLLSPVALSEPTATLTVPPTAAAWATETVESFFEQSTATAEGQETAVAATSTADADASATAAIEGTATPDPTTEAAGTATPDAAATALADLTATAEAPTPTPDPNATPTFTPVPTIEPSPTPDRNQAIATSEAGFELLDRNFLERASMSRGDFERLIARPQLARVRLNAVLGQEIEASQEQVRASHILVATRDAAIELIDSRLQTEDFAVVAEEVSTDTTSAINGGDLGWFPRGIMTEPFEEAAFSLEVGEMSEPIQSDFGWHIILVEDRADDRPLTVQMLQTLQQNAIAAWLVEQEATASISAEVPLPDGDGVSQLTTTQ